MTSICETCMEQTFSVFVENICSEVVATGLCDMIGVWWEPFVETACALIGGGK